MLFLKEEFVLITLVNQLNIHYLVENGCQLGGQGRVKGGKAILHDLGQSGSGEEEKAEKGHVEASGRHFEG